MKKALTLALTGALAATAALTVTSCGEGEGTEKTYTVTMTADPADKGSATAKTPDGTPAAQIEAKAGETVTLEASPQTGSGMFFGQWEVTAGGVTLFPDATSNPATFIMPAAEVAVTAGFTSAGELLLGKWGVSEFDIAFEGPAAFGSMITDMMMGNPADIALMESMYFDFKDEDTCVMGGTGINEGEKPYTLTGTTLSIADVEPFENGCRIDELTATTLVLYIDGLPSITAQYEHMDEASKAQYDELGFPEVTEIGMVFTLERE